MDNFELFKEVCDHIKEIYEAVESNNKHFDEELEDLNWRDDDYQDDINYIETQRNSVITSLEAEIPQYTFKVTYYDDDEAVFDTDDLYNDAQFGLPDVNNFKSIDIL